MVCFKKSGDTELKIGKDVVGAIQTDIDSWNKKISSGKDWSFKAFEPFAKMLAEKVKEDAKGLFALCTQPAQQRKVEFFIKPGLYDGHGESVKQQKEVENVKKLYDEANKKFQEISGLPQLTELNYEIYTAKTLKPLIDELIKLASSSSLSKLSKYTRAIENIQNGNFEINDIQALEGVINKIRIDAHAQQ
jgi:hypothetical protein